VLHDAFFKHQTKPPLTSPGDLYYEGKEFEAKNQEHKPGHVSSELREVGRSVRVSLSPRVTIPRCAALRRAALWWLFFCKQRAWSAPL